MTAKAPCSLLFTLACACALSCAMFAQSGAESLYKGTCATCHADNGSGNTNAGRKMKLVDLRSEYVQKQNDAELFKSVAHGTGHKEYPHAFLHRGLSEKDIQSLVGYVRELPRKK